MVPILLERVVVVIKLCFVSGPGLNASPGGKWRALGEKEAAEVALQLSFDAVRSAGLWNLSPVVMGDSHRKRVFPCQGDNRCGAGRSAVNLISDGTLLGTDQFLRMRVCLCGCGWFRRRAADG